MHVVLLIFLVAMMYAVESETVSISSNDNAFAALMDDGSVVTWGYASTRCSVLFLVFCVVICGCCCCRVRLRSFGWFCVAVGLVLLCVAVCTGVGVPHVASRATPWCQWLPY